MNNLGKSSIQKLAAGLLGFVTIVALGSLVTMLHHGSAAKAPMAAYANAGSPVFASPARIAPAPAAAAQAAASAAMPGSSSPLPVLPAEAARDVSAAPAEAQPAIIAGNAPASPALAAGAHVDMSGSASSSASAPAAVAAAAKPDPAAARRTAPASKRLLAKEADAAVASTVHYGVSGRSELMGRAAGPVYNFSGGGAKQGGQVAADNATAAGALRQVDDAVKQIDSSDLPAEQKAQLHQQLEKAQSAAPAPAP